MTNTQMRDAILLALNTDEIDRSLTAADVFPELTISREMALQFGDCVNQLRRQDLILATDNDGDPNDPSFMDVELTPLGKAMVEKLIGR